MHGIGCVSAKIHWICSAVSESSWNSMRACLVVRRYLTCASSMASSVRLTTLADEALGRGDRDLLVGLGVDDAVALTRHGAAHHVGDAEDLGAP